MQVKNIKFRFDEKVVIKSGFYGGYVATIKSYDVIKGDSKYEDSYDIEYEVSLRDKNKNLTVSQQHLRSYNLIDWVFRK